ncbi:uncharacterized protein LOC144943936 isoform X1 [Lampetra fluviatilis]
MASALAGRAHGHMQSPLLQVWLGPPCDSDLQQASRAAAASAAAAVATAARRGDVDDSSHSSGVWKTYPLRKRFSAFRLAGASSDAPKGDGGLVPSPPRPPPPSYQQHQQHQQLQLRERAEEGDAKGLSAADVAPRKRKAAVALFACGPPRGAARRSHKRRGAPSSDDDDDDDYEEEEDGYDVGGWAARLPGVRRRAHGGHGQQQHEPNHRWRGLREAPDDGQPVRKRRVASLNAEALVNLLLERDDDDLALAAPCAPQPAPPVPERHRATASGGGGSGVQRQQQQPQQQQQQQPRGSSTLVNRRSPCLAASAGPGQDCSLAQGSMLSETDAASLHPPASAVTGGAPGVERAEAEAFANSRADACKCPLAAIRDCRRPPVVVSAAPPILSAASAALAAASSASGAVLQSKSGGDGALAAQGVGYQQTAGTLPQVPWSPPAEPLDCRRIAPPPPSFSVPYSGCFLTGVGFQPSVTAGGVDFVPAASSSSSAVDDDVPLDLSTKRPGADRSRAADKRPPYDLGPGARPLRTGMTLEPAPTSRRNRTHPSLLGPRLFASRLAVVPPPQPPRLRPQQPRAPHGFADAMAPSMAYGGRNLSYTGTYFFGPGSSPPLLPCHRQGHEPTWHAEPGSGCYGSRWDEQPPPPKIPKLDLDRIPSTSTSSSSSSPQLPPDTLHRDSTTTPCLQPPPPPPPPPSNHHQDHHRDVNDNNRRHHHSDRHSPSDSHGHKHKHGHGNHHKDDGAQNRRRDSSCEPSSVPADPAPPCAPEGRADRRGATGRFCRSLSLGAACGPPGERPLRLEERPSPPSSGDGTARRNERPPLPKIVIKKWALACGGAGVADDGSTPRTPRTPQLTSPPAEGNVGRRLRVGQRRATGSGSKWFPVGKAFEKAVYVVGEAELAVRRCFSAVRCAGLVVRVRDCVLLRSGARRRSLPFVAKISALWEDPRSGELTMSLFWYYRPEHTQGGRPAYKHCQQSEIFASRHQDVNSVACIEEKCYVLTFAEYCRFWADIERRREGLAAGAPTTEASGTGGLLLPPPPPTVPPHPAGCSAPLHRRVPPDTDPELVFLSRAVYDFRHHRLLKNPFRPALSPVPR